jgi:hypothetical protein
MTPLAKCFFVGMHNKPGMVPLDSKTRTGRVIDQIIEQLPFTCVKTNLCEVPYMPETETIDTYAEAWHQKYAPGENDIVVTLGSWVKTRFKKRNHRLIFLGHPAGVFGPKTRLDYIVKSIAKIKAC